MVGEVARVGEAYRLGHLRDGEAGAREQGFRPFDAPVDDVLVRREPGDCLERACEVVGLMCAAPAISSSVSLRERLSFM